MDNLVDLIGIEPMTSSMPWKRAPSCATGPHQRVVLLSFTRTNSSICSHAGNWPAASGIVHEDMSLQKSLRLLLGLILFLLSPAGFAQPGATNSAPSGVGAAPAVSAASVSAIVQPALSDIQSTGGSLNTGRGKAPNEVK